MTVRLLSTVALLALTTGNVNAQDLKIGLEEDPDVLDPDQSRSFVGRIVYASLCDKLVDITPELEIIPQLATDWSWNDAGTELTMTLRDDVTFHDGTPFNADAVVRNIDRSQNLDESRRKSEVASIDSVEATGEHEVLITVSEPDATLIAQFADRAGMMVSPDAAEEAGARFGLNPVCSGPYLFSERVAQERIDLERFDDYWNAEAHAFDSVSFLPIPDTTVRFANLRSGDIHMLERLATADIAAAEDDEGINVTTATSLGYQGITFNVANGAAAENPWGQDARLRKALSLAIDREALNQVVFDGNFVPGNQPFPPESPWYDNDQPVPPRDVEAAKALLAEAGVEDGIELKVQTQNSNVPQQVLQVIQAMAAEAGINISITSKEFATLLSDQTAGDYTASQIGWSGRVDPDGNIHQFVTTDGGINDSGFSNPKVDEALNAARNSTDTDKRKQHYDTAREILLEEAPLVYLYHQSWVTALDASIEGFEPYPDGMIRLENVSMSEPE